VDVSTVSTSDDDKWLCKYVGVLLLPPEISK
jgi:hypothetical protein